jgi:hypothetical protein
MIRAATGLLLLFAACTDHVQLAKDPLDGLVSLVVMPAETTITITDLSEPTQELHYHAIGKFLDGTKHDVTDLVRWTVDNRFPGDFIEAGDYQTSNEAAGHVVVHADGETLSATAALDVIITVTVIDGAFPPPAAELFTPDATVILGDPTHAPNVVYPSNGTELPQGVASTLFQYTTGAGNDTFQLSFDCDVLHLAVQTGADRWLASDVTQSVIAESCIGEPLAVTLLGASSASGNIYGAGQVAIQFSTDSPDGIIYYESSATAGIMRGELATPSASKVYPLDTTPVCCHTVSRLGDALAMSYPGEFLQTIALPSLATTIPATAKIPMGWASYSPDGTRLVVANLGVLTLYEAATGKPVGPGGGRVPLPPMKFATHPDWSPDGAYVAVALTSTMITSNADVAAASIARIPFRADVWGPAEILVSTAGSDNDYFPRYSPDGTHLAYVHATEPAVTAASAELWLVPSAGGTPIALATASHRVGGVDGVPGLADTMPTWAPVQGERAWLAFVSARAYGVVLPAGQSQIWIASVDLAHAATTSDPSGAGFWLPSQDVTVLNNNPVWSPSPTP